MRAIVVAMMLATTPAMACNADLLTVQDWKVSANEQSRILPYLLEATVRYEGDRPYRMIHAGVMFADVLGAAIGQVNLPRDARIEPDADVVADGQVTVNERLSTLNRDDVTYRTCVWSIVYDDGEVQRFD